MQKLVIESQASVASHYVTQENVSRVPTASTTGRKDGGDSLGMQWLSLGKAKMLGKSKGIQIVQVLIFFSASPISSKNLNGER